MRSVLVETKEVRNVYQPEDESVVRHGGAVIIGHHTGEDKYTVNVANPALGMSGFVVLDRAEMANLRDALNKELAS